MSLKGFQVYVKINYKIYQCVKHSSHIFIINYLSVIFLIRVFLKVVNARISIRVKTSTFKKNSSKHLRICLVIINLFFICSSYNHPNFLCYFSYWWLKAFKICFLCILNITNHIQIFYFIYTFQTTFRWPCLFDYQH